MLISLLVGLSFVGLTLGVWYPGPLFEVSGAIGLLSILVPVDVALGPFLTLLVYKRGKPSLVFDLSVIALLQTGALVYGAWTIAEVRPAYVVLFDKQLEVVRSMDVEKGAPWRAPLFGPEWVFVKPKPAEDLLKAVLKGDLPTRDREQYQPLIAHNAELRASMRTISDLNQQSVKAEMSQALIAKQIDPERVGLLPMLVRDLIVTAVFDRESLELIAIVPTTI
ncbi:MAG TPA: hypothetical protein VFV64_01975 [Permianibacter sp.]|nr:hypothetical protein [Permianibacter sp.]